LLHRLGARPLPVTQERTFWLDVFGWLVKYPEFQNVLIRFLAVRMGQRLVGFLRHN
jgi:hypothetical protein